MKPIIFKHILLASFLTTSTLAIAQSENYVAHITSLNSSKTGYNPSGTATFKIKGNNLVIHVKMDGTPPNIQHWEHFHGFPDGAEAQCPTAANDSNGDGFVDLMETGQSMGTTMVPFNDKPEVMNIPTDTYPKANAKGSYEYTKIVPLTTLQAKFGKTYEGQQIDLDKRVFMVHGVPTSLTLPDSVGGQVGSYGTHVTLPIACGKIEKVK
ncbi:hypothetical protein [Burkholderia alba]|uniref:hypothetical protein n=1 Tax=Burkholderia alba TaxID=2683677 RepID=UPI002B056433|nr:hypothetical protein [Burkholderia alba]